MLSKIRLEYIKKSNFIITFFLIIFFSITSFFYFNKSFSFHFADEEHNFTIGKYLLRNEVLYKDLYSNHQPLQLILSSKIQQIFNINSLNTLIKRHREFMIFYSSLWSLVLFWQFRKKVVFFVLLYEVSKIYLLGNLFLAESLTVYPLIYLELSYFLKKTLNKWESFFIGICAGSIFFMLAPLWPAVIFLVILYCLKFKSKVFLIFSFPGFSLILLLTYFYIDLKNYFYLTVISNLKYTVPSMDYFGPFYLTFIKAFFAPIISFFPSTAQTPILVVERSLSSLLLINILIMIYLKKYILPLSIFLILGFINLRFYPPGMDYYRGFHSLSWYGSLIIFTQFSSFYVLGLLNKSWFKLFIYFFFFITLLLVFSLATNSLFKKSDPATDFFVNYSSQYSFGEAAKIMGNKNDTIYVFPEDWLIYWQSNLNHPENSFGYYLWLENIPELKKNLLNSFNKKPPTFLYCKRCDTTDFSIYLPLYSPLLKDGNKTDMYVLRTKIIGLNKEQLDLMKFHNFSFN